MNSGLPGEADIGQADVEIKGLGEQGLQLVALKEHDETRGLTKTDNQVALGIKMNEQILENTQKEKIFNQRIASIQRAEAGGYDDDQM